MPRVPSTRNIVTTVECKRIECFSSSKQINLMSDYEAAAAQPDIPPGFEGVLHFYREKKKRKKETRKN